MNEPAVILLKSWVESHSEGAFEQLVANHLDLVYSVALRRVAGDTGLAADITQTVFCDLARKATSLRQEGSLSGWLHRHTCHVSATHHRSELRRRAREQTAAAMQAIEHEPGPDWSQLAPVLDDAVNALDDADRRAILLRFYEQRDLRSVGTALGISDDTAQKRVSRALQKMREWLMHRGIRSSATALTAMLTAHNVTAAPAGLAATVTSAALAGTAAAAGTVASTVTLFKLMATTKAKIGVGAALAALVATPIVWQEQLIAKTRSQNESLRLEIARSETFSEQAWNAAAMDAASRSASAARDRAELAELREQVAARRAELEQTRAVRNQLAREPANQGKQQGMLPEGYFSIHDAQDVGATTPDAMFQTWAWAVRHGHTNRFAALMIPNGEDGLRMIEELLKIIPEELASGEFEQPDLGYRVLRQVPLANGDVALVLDTHKQGKSERSAIRVQFVDGKWKMLMGKNGPEEVQLSEDLMRD